MDYNKLIRERNYLIWDYLNDSVWIYHQYDKNIAKNRDIRENEMIEVFKTFRESKSENEMLDKISAIKKKYDEPIYTSFILDIKGDGFVYIVECNNFIKIGYTSNLIKKRVAAIQTSSPYPVILKGYFKNVNNNFERILHNAFEKHKKRGEWFNKSVLEEIKKIYPQFILS